MTANDPNDDLIYIGTPDDWWEQAEEISTAEAQERTLGDWYITVIRTAGDPSQATG